MAQSPQQQSPDASSPGSAVASAQQPSGMPYYPAQPPTCSIIRSAGGATARSSGPSPSVSSSWNAYCAQNQGNVNSGGAGAPADVAAYQTSGMQAGAARPEDFCLPFIKPGGSGPSRGYCTCFK
eukprot:gene4432-4687_t